MLTKKLIFILIGLFLITSCAACSFETMNDIQTRIQQEQTASNEEDEQTVTTNLESTLIDSQNTNNYTTKFEERTIWEDEDFTFKITEISTDSIWGYTLKVYLENKTDINLMFTWSDVSVNGFMCDPFWATTVTAGMKSNEQIHFSTASFDTNGITNVTYIEFKLTVYNSDNWSSDYLINDIFTIYPIGEDEVQIYERIAQEGEIVLINDDNCTIIVTGFDPDNIWGYTMNIYLENKTDITLMFSVDNASVNGFMCDPFWATTVTARKRYNTSMSWSSSDFKTNGITDVELITLPIKVYNSDDWSAKYLIDETFIIYP